ncbi:MAG: LLM class flavin-dependent oxidoreductase [Acidimicrobiales bacterium]
MIEFSLTLPRFHDPDDSVPYRRSYEFARTVDQLGYHAGFIGHHSFSPEVMDEAAPFVFLSALGAHTERIRLGTGVYLAGLHHPANIIEQVSTLDRITGGRAILGVGTGYRPYEFETYGTDYKTRGKRLDETLAVVRKAWDTGSYEWDGDFFSFDDVPVFPPAVQRPNPPIYVGGTSNPAIRRAASLGDTWFTLPMETLSVVTELVGKYRAACEKAGTTPRICLMREAWVGENDAEVEAEWYPRALSFHRYYWEAGTKGDDHDPVLQRVAAGEDPPYQEFVRDRAFAGTPELVIEEIQRWHDAIGFDEVCCIFATGREATTQEALTRAVTLFADEVMPAFR